ncbi:MBL fold metallo-hydrolase [Dictyobacter aurantiacus]|uniref:MBL fold metallo-hydrolase n=1 Tax=Dictyobacter aurantiacus TaxID=1936993 RepID=A0A401Z8F8_9CHLR|nr:MBL fold metallo-hydrolase [Dictyobacter aurantiacus]GCE03125.1 MBL fold metallo-hydrolase [Dictyobacter aurantiacus]
MKVTAAGDNLFQLTYLRAVNCYLVREDDGFTLIDTAWPASQAQAILAEAKKLGLPIVRILLTHDHSDHVGSLDALHAALPDVPVAISGREARLMAGDVSLDASEPQDKKLGNYPCQTKPTFLLNEGDRIGSLEVVFSPGHSVGHVAFLDTRDRSLIAGDAFQTLGGVAVAGTVKPLFPLPALSTWNKGIALESARKLLNLQPSLLAIGHGRMLSQPQVAMERAIHVLERELSQKQRERTHVA